MKRKNLWIWGLMVVVSFLAACQPGTTASSGKTGSAVGNVIQTEGGSYRDISATELLAMMAAKDFTLVNVHIPFEGNLPKTDVSIPYDTIGQNLAKLPADKNSRIVLYCRSGSMSTTAAKDLVKLGYTQIMNVSGGMYAWEQAGQKIEK